MEQLIYPTARGMCAEGTPFRGVIFAGLMIKDGQVGRQHLFTNDQKKNCRLRGWSSRSPAHALRAASGGRPGSPSSAATPPSTTTSHPGCCRSTAHTACDPPLLQAKLLEHNVRFGDPECQSLMVRLQSDLLESLQAQCRGEEVSGQRAQRAGAGPAGAAGRHGGAAIADQDKLLHASHAGLEKSGRRKLW